MKKGIVFIFLIVFLLPFCRAIVGVSPAKYEVNFEPNLKQRFYFEFIGDTGTEFEVYPEGDLADYLQISTNYLKGRGKVYADLQLPDKIEVPGKHRLYVTAAQQSNSKGKGFAIVGTVRGVIQINVPYPGKYAEIDFTTEDVKAGEDVPFKITINNLGKESIDTKTYIEIYDSFGEKIETFYAGSNHISPKEKAEIESALATSKYKPGKYDVVALVEYDGKTARKKSIFRVGELHVGISKYSNGFQKGKINRFEIEVESFWNDPIKNLYAEVTILDTNSKFMTPSITLEGFQKGMLTGFFDTTGIKGDKFKAKIKLHYEGKVTEKIVELSFKKEINYALYIIIATIITFLMIVIFLSVKLIGLERRLDEKSKRHGKK